MAIDAAADLGRARAALPPPTHTDLDEVEPVRPLTAAVAERSQPQLDAIAALPDPAEQDNPGLSRAELRLLPLLMTHLSLREIGDYLLVSQNTVKTQVMSIHRKLGTTSRRGTVARAIQLGLIDGEALPYR
jgi:LuxR family maltose regulon positive regulatory protein